MCKVPTHRFPLLHVVHVKVLVLPRSDDELPPVGREVRRPYRIVLEVDGLFKISQSCTYWVFDPDILNSKSCRKHVSLRVCVQWKKEQASRCCTADVCLCQSANKLYNNQKMAKLVLFSTAWSRYSL